MSKPKKAVNKVLDILSTVIIILLLICVISNFQTTILGKSYNSLFGYSLFEVKTGSMSGTLEVGDWILVKVTKDVECDDVITFEQNGAVITHRIVETYGDTIVTKGDSNNAKDDPITKENVIGKLVKVLPSFAIIKKTLLNTKVLILLFALIIVANSIFNKDLTDKIKGYFKNKPKKAKVETDEEKKVKEIIEEVPATSKTTLLSKVDVDFENSMISKVKDALEDDNQKSAPVVETKKDLTEDIKISKEKVESLDIPEENASEESAPEDNINVNVSEDAYSKIVNKITEKDSKEEVENAGNIEDLSLDALAKKSKKDILKEFLAEADALDEEREQNFTDDLALITKKLGIDTKIEIGKEEKSIIKKYLALKKSEIKRLFYIILEANEENAEYRAVINKFLDAYIEYLYLKLCDKETAKNPLLNVSKIFAAFNKSYLETTTSASKKKIIERVYLAANAILQIELSGYDEKTVNKIFKSPRMEFSDAEVIKKIFLSEYKKYNEAYKIFNKRIDSKKLYIELNKVTNYNLYISKMNVNIKFSKIFSDYIIDKTYADAMIVEALKEVEIVQLTAELVNDLMTYNAKRKYLLYLPESLYKKPKKLLSMLKLIDDEYSQNKIYILINEDIYKNNIKMLGELKKEGYKLILETDLKHLQNYNHGRIGLYVSNIILIDSDKDVNISNLQVDTLNKDNFIVLNKSCIVGGDFK